jgi:hypothetical protein
MGDGPQFMPLVASDLGRTISAMLQICYLASLSTIDLNAVKKHLQKNQNIHETMTKNTTNHPNPE